MSEISLVVSATKQIIQREVDELIYQKSCDEFDAQMPSWLKRVLIARGVESQEHLNADLSLLENPMSMLGVQEALELLLGTEHQSSLAQLSRPFILIVGDFDADGATSTALLMQGLGDLGFTKLDYFLPDRFEFGYGLSEAIVEHICNSDVFSQRPDIIITVDNGISSIEGVAAAKKNGIKVIVTDHHLPGEKLPKADAIVNPNQLDCGFRYKNLAGVGVAFHLLVALRKLMRDRGYFSEFMDDGLKEPNLSKLLDLVALGTVADVVRLDQYNRMLVSQGLSRIRQGEVRPGIKALLQIGKRDYRFTVSQDLGFAVGPRINAAGRLDNMNLGVDLLLESNEQRAFELAVQLDELNQDRKIIEKQMQAEAELMATKVVAELSGEAPKILCVYHEQWHQGVVGLVASKLKEKLHCPVIAFAPVFNDDGELLNLKGSGRSIEGVHLRDLLDLVAKQDGRVLQKFGGHAMAAGLSILPKDLQRLEKLLQQALLDVDENIFKASILTDGILPGKALTLEQARQLELLLPWGQGCEEPKFEGEFQLQAMRVLAEAHVKLDLLDVSSGGQISAIQFFADIDRWHEVQNSATKMVRVVYKLSVNRFRGNESLQLVIDFIE